MAATALHIVRTVLPDCPVRQWALSVPFAVHRLLAADARLFGAVVKLFARVVERFYLERARAAGIEGAKTGALSFQQRFGGSLNAHCHVHAAWVDGVFSLDPSTSKPRFHFTAPPTPQDVQHVAAAVAASIDLALSPGACAARNFAALRNPPPRYSGGSLCSEPSCSESFLASCTTLQKNSISRLICCRAGDRHSVRA